jgi:hypothetical protein
LKISARKHWKNELKSIINAHLRWIKEPIEATACDSDHATDPPLELQALRNTCNAVNLRK